METNKNGFDLDIRNEDRAIRKGNNFLKGDTEGGNSGDKKKGVPKDRANASMFNRVSNKTAGKNTSFILGPKPGPSAPMIRDSANMCEGKSKGLRGTKSICFNYLGNRIVTRGRSKNPPGLEGNKGTETEGRRLGLDSLINLFLKE